MTTVAGTKEEFAAVQNAGPGVPRNMILGGLVIQRRSEALRITPTLDVHLPSLAIAALMALSAARTRW